MSFVVRGGAGKHRVERKKKIKIKRRKKKRKKIQHHTTTHNKQQFFDRTIMIIKPTNTIMWLACLIYELITAS